MSQAVFRGLCVVLLAIGIAAPLAATAQTKSLPSRENDEGQVMVTVTPVSLANGASPWRFEVRLNTHVAPITQDLAAVSNLTDGAGHDEQPSTWEGDPPGGHHRKGVLIFKPISPTPTSITLHIGQVGGVAERSFTWNLTNP